MSSSLQHRPAYLDEILWFGSLSNWQLFLLAESGQLREDEMDEDASRAALDALEKINKMTTDNKATTTHS
jgi:hypothetical protein